MTLLGFHFKKMSVEKNKNATGSINIKNNMTVTKVREAKLNLGKDRQTGIEFSFTFHVGYEPGIASIDLEGGVLYVSNTKQAEEILKNWEKKKQLPEDLMKEVSLHVVSKCNVQAIVLAKEMQLPPHIAMVKISDEKKKK
ncbi:TPA: hypothetical protein HA239_03550 [Candidatus Woesearchaeota archaeon]|nr:hypothetical protein QT06_C0001G0479 [archaeon GW2011_AR15]MBS3103790.1 hypothetical protein [Candidatus Woesearchaeota archaeon]HIH41465.1 hypothetical protein [Candidatus Woesearchaeota archaeon]